MVLDIDISPTFRSVASLYKSLKKYKCTVSSDFDLNYRTGPGLLKSQTINNALQAGLTL